MTKKSRRRASKARSSAQKKEDAQIVKYNVLTLGASYGSLFGTKLLMAGHRVSLVCTKSTADLINREGTIVRMPIKGRSELLDIASKNLPGSLSASTPDDSDPSGFDLIVLGMQE